MTPYEVAQEILDAAVDAIVDPPERQYVAAGNRQPVRCEQVVVTFSRLVPQPDNQKMPCPMFNVLSVCVAVSRCFPVIKDRTAIPTDEIEAAAAVISQDGIDLYLALDHDALAALVGCTLTTGPVVEWGDPMGGYQTVRACVTLDFTPGVDGS